MGGMVSEATKVKTAQQLLEFLLLQSKDDLKKPVEMQGCDCVGEMGAVEVDHDSVYLRRT